MSDGDSGYIIVMAIMCIFAYGVGWEMGENNGERDIVARVVSSQEYVEALRSIARSQNKINTLKEQVE